MSILQKLPIADHHRVFVDTNVFVYCFDPDEPRKQTVATELLDDLGARRIVLSAQVLNEFYVTVTRKLKRPLEEAQAVAIVGAMAALDVVPVDAALVKAGVDRSRTSQLSLWDALVVESARQADCPVVLTEDLNAGTDFDGAMVVNPFASGTRGE